MRIASLGVWMVVGAVMGCGGEPNAPPKPQQHAAHFAYAGDEGPSRWASLDPAWALCASGTRQSPIELPESAPPDPAHAMGAQTYEPVPIHIANNGHTIQVNDTATSSLVVDGATYALAQFHFHVPAEHVVAGKHFDAEMHLVHKTHDGHVAVVALFVKSGQPNAALAAVIDHAPEATTTEDVVVPGASVDLQAMLPKAPTYLRYDGSLTVPPCTEGVTWLVVPPATGLVEMSPDQIAKLGAAMHAPTNRPLQPLNGRAVSTVRP